MFISIKGGIAGFFPRDDTTSGSNQQKTGEEKTGEEVNAVEAVPVKVTTDDYDFLAGIALSRLGIIPSQFYELTPIEFDYAIKDFDQRERDKIEVLIRNEAEMTRWQTMHLLNPHLKKDKQIKDPKKLGRFPWDPEPKPMTLEQMRAALYAIAGQPYKA